MKLMESGLVAGAVVLLTGCATIIHGGGSQDVAVSSTPPGAAVVIDNVSYGVTPTVANLRRKNAHVVTMQLPGYDTASQTVTSKVSGWVWGNIVLGGLIGLAVDATSGGMYNLAPEQLHADLRPNGAVAAGTPAVPASVPSTAVAPNIPVAPPQQLAAPLVNGSTAMVAIGTKLRAQAKYDAPVLFTTTTAEQVTLQGSSNLPTGQWWYVRGARVAGWVLSSEITGQ